MHWSSGLMTLPRLAGMGVRMARATITTIAPPGGDETLC